MQTRDQEITAMIRQLRSDPLFRDAPTRTQLLDYLVSKRGTIVPSRQLAKECFQIKPIDYDALSNRVRERCKDLRQALAQYKSPANALWQCRFPKASRGQGYSLEITRVEREYDPTEQFWLPHLKAADQVIVVTNSYLFFYDPEQDSMFRFSEVNSEGDEKDALLALKASRPAVHRKDLRSNYFYVSTGEVTAFETLLHWFYDRTRLLIPRYVSRDVLNKEFQASSPILLGRPGANRFIERLLDSEAAAHLGYRFRNPLGAVQIDNPRSNEREALAKFSMTNDGKVGPVAGWNVVFGIVTRLPHPSGNGSVTIITAAYNARVIAQIVSSITDKKASAKLLSQLRQPSRAPLPDSFEMLFAVQPAPGGIEGEGRAELLCWRFYPEQVT